MDNQSKILDCSLELFSARGYDAVGIQEIVEAAGVTKPTLYHYFNSKRGLLDALLAAQFGPLTERVEQAADYHGDLVLTLQKVVKVYFEYAEERPAFFRLQLAMYFAPPASEPNLAVAGHQKRLYQVLEDVFSAAVVQHGNMRGRQRVYAATFMGMINTYVGLYLNNSIELADPLMYQAVHQFMHGIFS